MRERLQKIIAQAGIASRRAAEELILAGRVRLNGRVVTELGTQADPRTDKVEVDGKRLVAEAPVYFVFHKPKNVVSTLSDPEGRPTVAEYLKLAGTRVYPVGRLDFSTSGVLLATNDGELANALLHPKKDVPKTYVVKVRGLMSDEDLDRWRRGVDLEDGRTLPAKAKMLRHEDDKTWFEITIREGRNQQIRRMGEATGFFVMRLARTSFAGIDHEGLRPGQLRRMTAQELKALQETYGVPRRIPKGAPRQAPLPEAGAPPRVRSAKSARSETTPRAAERPAPRARERGGRAAKRGRS